MATLSELSESLLKRFKDVPNVTIEDTDGWIERSMLEHNLRPEQDVPQDIVLLILLFAEWDGTLQIALKTAFYFQYKDAEESVDKRNVSEQYRKVAADLKKRYEKHKMDSGVSNSGPTFHIATRADR